MSINLPLQMLINAIEYQCEANNSVISRDKRYKHLLEKSLKAERALKESIQAAPNGPELFQEYDTCNAELQGYAVAALYFAGFTLALRFIGEEDLAIDLDYLIEEKRLAEAKTH